MQSTDSEVACSAPRILSVLAGRAERRLITSDMHHQHNYTTPHRHPPHDLPSCTHLSPPGQRESQYLLHPRPPWLCWHRHRIKSLSWACQKGAITSTSLLGAVARFLGSALLVPPFQGFHFNVGRGVRSEAGLSRHKRYVCMCCRTAAGQHQPWI